MTFISLKVFFKVRKTTYKNSKGQNFPLAVRFTNILGYTNIFNCNYGQFLRA